MASWNKFAIPFAPRESALLPFLMQKPLYDLNSYTGNLSK
ncbi:hypothetical protein B4166_3854 [Caldibacillus thermoamylovorans]|uniref:Uncharacterized protein n=1 Tax=Caldibacillus thermoamylovorans TaxID=35841 RepID=A0ABD4AB79_9BACI|nr:hypothetical protein B4166_3854 [Caldibacillus thermoamylovorans]KIO74373.1 hypothetical protein B4167_1501 [Caldibacillus thermoamylovorans]